MRPDVSAGSCPSLCCPTPHQVRLSRELLETQLKEERAKEMLTEHQTARATMRAEKEKLEKEVEELTERLEAATRDRAVGAPCMRGVDHA